MSLTNYDYNQMNEILKNFAKQLNGITQAKREVTIPLNEYEEIKRKEKLYYEKIELLNKIEDQIKLILKFKAEQWDSKQLYDTILEIYKKIVTYR